MSTIPSKTDLIQYLRVCADLAGQKGSDGLAYVSPVELHRAIELLSAVETTVCRWLRSDRGDGHLSAFIEANCGVSFNVSLGLEREYRFCPACGKRTVLQGSPLEPSELQRCSWTDNGSPCIYVKNHTAPHVSEHRAAEKATALHPERCVCSECIQNRWLAENGTGDV